MDDDDANDYDVSIVAVRVVAPRNPDGQAGDEAEDEQHQAEDDDQAGAALGAAPSCGFNQRHREAVRALQTPHGRNRIRGKIGDPKKTEKSNKSGNRGKFADAQTGTREGGLCPTQQRALPRGADSLKQSLQGAKNTQVRNRKESGKNEKEGRNKSTKEETPIEK
ncbi:hypothetical protein TGVAND_358930 [Toxoplasma gondii VAND]|uniref:Uncharacterized protein n=1 Tax=Toxoplasma gondii VAND TaxID=933077 RepID=A0A086Q588_TOXGO|nr:hypothetical protein TGVAND_358930 [Toxoplasma gondii VAND]